MTSKILKLFKKNQDWPGVDRIIKKCHERGFLTVIAGGAVRDALLGQVPKDFDLATEARPQDLIKIFPKAHEVGRSFGVIWLPLKNKSGVEVATFRKEGRYLDGRHPLDVKFCSIEEDVQRRDFTINALYFDVQKNQLIDFVDGQKDLKNKKIKTVGLARDRFQEDKLRMLRALRFSSVYNFKIEPSTLNEIQKNFSTIHKISKERIYDEINKTFKQGSFKRTMHLFRKVGVFQILWPRWPWKQAFPKSLWQIQSSKSWPSFIWWSLMMTPVVLESLSHSSLKQVNRKLKNYLVLTGLPSKKIKKILRFYNFFLDIQKNDVALGQKIRWLDEEDGMYFLDLTFHILQSKKNLKKTKKAIADLKKVVRFYKKIKTPKGLPLPFLRGFDLIKKQNLKPGPQISKLFDYFYHQQLEGKIKSKTQALKILKKSDLKELLG